MRERLDEEGVVGRQIELAAWDLRPAWLNGSKRPQFNEWLEPSPEKPMFKNAFTSRRALLPLSGYFEWTGEKGAPHYVSACGALLSTAGLYEVRSVDEEWEAVRDDHPYRGRASAHHADGDVLGVIDAWTRNMNRDTLE